MFKRTASPGFTLVEIIVAVSIITILLSVLMFSIVEVRKNSRDKARVADLAQIEFALNAYREANKTYPIFDEEMVVGSGELIDADLAQFWPQPITDPLNDSEHAYVYNSNLECDGERYIALIATNLEREDAGNTDEVCPGLSGYDNSFILLVDGPIQAGTTAAGGAVQNEGDWWTDPANQSTLNMTDYLEALTAAQSDTSGATTNTTNTTNTTATPTLIDCQRVTITTQQCSYSDGSSCRNRRGDPPCTTW